MISKVQGLVNSEIITELVIKKLENSEVGREINGWIDVFNNCRETGYILRDGAKDHNIWICECRNSDDILVYIGTSEGLNCMFSEDTYRHGRKSFKYEDFMGAANYIFEYIRDNWVREYKSTYNEDCWKNQKL